jgi:hypothetical protein
MEKGRREGEGSREEGGGETHHGLLLPLRDGLSLWLGKTVPCFGTDGAFIDFQNAFTCQEGDHTIHRTELPKHLPSLTANNHSHSSISAPKYSCFFTLNSNSSSSLF